MTDDQDLMAALFVSDAGAIECHPEWDGKQTGDSIFLPICTDREDLLDHEKSRRCFQTWDKFWIPANIAAGILRLIRQRDEAKQKAADWEQTARELMKTKPGNH